MNRRWTYEAVKIHKGRIYVTESLACENLNPPQAAGRTKTNMQKG